MYVYCIAMYNNYNYYITIYLVVKLTVAIPLSSHLYCKHGFFHIYSSYRNPPIQNPDNSII